MEYLYYFLSFLGYKPGVTAPARAFSDEILQDNEGNIFLLPAELIDHILSFLDKKSLLRFSQTSQCANRFFLQATSHEFFLEKCMNGESKEVEKILLKLQLSNSKYWHIILRQRHGKERCGRKWFTSALEYLAAVGDKFMRDLILEHIPLEFKYLALNQLRNILKTGTEHGAPLALLDPMIKAYQELDNQQWTEKECNHHWQSVLGPLQITLPVVVLQEVYCGPENYSYFSDFDESPNRNCTILDTSGMLNYQIPMFPFENKNIGERNTLYRGKASFCLYTPYVKQFADGEYQMDLARLCDFRAMRMRDLQNQVEILEKLVEQYDADARQTNRYRKK